VLWVKVGIAVRAACARAVPDEPRKGDVIMVLTAFFTGLFDLLAGFLTEYVIGLLTGLITGALGLGA